MSGLSQQSQLLSPSDCKFCHSDTNLQRIKFPCDCLIYAHPDCYNEYSSIKKERIDGRWRLRCPQCDGDIILPDHLRIQINIPLDDDDYRPITRREARLERCKVCAILSVQCTLMLGILVFATWWYVKLVTGTLRAL
jgi:hypothetical protein